jgi:FkbM family methyltransferase
VTDPIVEYDGRSVQFVGEYTGSYACIAAGKFYELPLLERIRSMNLPGTYLDVGTNIGNHALFFALFCACDKVIGFEPVRAWRARALSNIAANDCGDVVDVREYGLYDCETVIEFNPYGTPHMLPCTTLDLALPTITGVSLIKLDIEGSEPMALRGGKNFFERNQPLMYAEVLGDPADIFSAVKCIGYAHTGVIMPGTPMYEFAPT